MNKKYKMYLEGGKSTAQRIQEETLPPHTILLVRLILLAFATSFLNDQFCCTILLKAAQSSLTLGHICFPSICLSFTQTEKSNHKTRCEPWNDVFITSSYHSTHCIFCFPSCDENFPYFGMLLGKWFISQGYDQSIKANLFQNAIFVI